MLILNFCFLNKLNIFYIQRMSFARNRGWCLHLKFSGYNAEWNSPFKAESVYTVIAGFAREQLFSRVIKGYWAETVIIYFQNGMEEFGDWGLVDEGEFKYCFLFIFIRPFPMTQINNYPRTSYESH